MASGRSFLVLLSRSEAQQEEPLTKEAQSHDQLLPCLGYRGQCESIRIEAMTIGVIVVIGALNEQEKCTLCSYHRSFLCVEER